MTCNDNYFLNFSDFFKRIVDRFKEAGIYYSDIMRQIACLVLNPIMVEGYNALFSCTSVVQASDSITALTRSFKYIYIYSWLKLDDCLWLDPQWFN